MTIQLDTLSYIGIACILLVTFASGAIVAGYQRHLDWNKAYKKGREDGWRAAALWFTEKVDSGEITFTEPGGGSRKTK